MKSKYATAMWLMAGILAVLVVLVLQVIWGSVPLLLADVLQALMGQSRDAVVQHIIWQSRVPAAIAAIAAGAALAVSGLQMQTYFRNPVAGPYVLGISSGASLGVAFYYLSGHLLQIQWPEWILTGGAVFAAFAGASLLFLFNMTIAVRLRNPVAMLIVGLMIAGGINALIDILQSFSDADALKNFVFWSFGSFRHITLLQSGFLLLVVIAGLLLSIRLCPALDVLMLGDTYATTSGLNLASFRWQLLFVTSLLAGIVTAFCGPIGFVGLAVPHMARGLLRTSAHLPLTIACVFLGAVICSLCSLISVLPGTGTAIPLNAVTSILGAPFVIWIILKRR